jgi:hypothetical protein
VPGDRDSGAHLLAWMKISRNHSAPTNESNWASSVRKAITSQAITPTRNRGKTEDAESGSSGPAPEAVTRTTAYAST